MIAANLEGPHFWRGNAEKYRVARDTRDRVLVVLTSYHVIQSSINARAVGGGNNPQTIESQHGNRSLSAIYTPYTCSHQHGNLYYARA